MVVRIAWLGNKDFGLGESFSTGAHGAVLRKPRAEAFAKWLFRDIAKSYWWTGGHKCWESLEGGNKPWKVENHWPRCSVQLRGKTFRENIYHKGNKWISDVQRIKKIWLMSLHDIQRNGCYAALKLQQKSLFCEFHSIISQCFESFHLLQKNTLLT